MLNDLMPSDLPNDLYVVAIVLLLPLMSILLVSQVNPYHALVIRGILGAIAALVYALFGAADVALTEALVGTMLSITLYAIAVRSSMSMRLGVLAPAITPASDHSDAPSLPEPVLSSLRTVLNQYHLRLEIVPYSDSQALRAALMAKDVHSIWVASNAPPIEDVSLSTPVDEPTSYHVQTRVQRLYDIMKTDLPSTTVSLTRVNPAHPHPSSMSQRQGGFSNPVEGQP